MFKVAIATPLIRRILLWLLTSCPALHVAIFVHHRSLPHARTVENLTIDNSESLRNSRTYSYAFVLNSSRVSELAPGGLRGFGRSYFSRCTADQKNTKLPRHLTRPQHAPNQAAFSFQNRPHKSCCLLCFVFGYLCKRLKHFHQDKPRPLSTHANTK